MTTSDTPANIRAGLTAEQIIELDEILDDTRAHAEEIPQWEFCDGALTALVCTRRPVPVEEFLPMLVGDGEPITRNADGSLPLLPAFADAQQQQRFLELWQIRWDQVSTQLDDDAEELTEEDDSFDPCVMDLRGFVANLPAQDRAQLDTEDIPSFGQVWALGFMFVVENWSEEWAAPRDAEAAFWINEALDCIVALTEDDTGTPTVCMYDDNGPASTSEQRVEAFGEALWAIYDLRQIWQSLGPRQPTIIKGKTPGRNDPCSCGSGKKYKKCCGA